MTEGVTFILNFVSINQLILTAKPGDTETNGDLIRMVSFLLRRKSGLDRGIIIIIIIIIHFINGKA